MRMHQNECTKRYLPRMPYFDNCLNILFHVNYGDDMNRIKGRKIGRKIKENCFHTI